MTHANLSQLLAAIGLLICSFAGASEHTSEEDEPLGKPPAILTQPSLQPLAQDQTDDIFEQDWLSALRGRHRFSEGLISVNPDDLRRFLITGNVTDYLVFGSAVVEIRTGTFISTDDEPDDSVDIPASVIITYKGRRMAGAKGYRLGAEIVKDGVKIAHWNGREGCSVKQWILKFRGERMYIDNISYFELDGEVQCTPPDTDEASP